MRRIIVSSFILFTGLCICIALSILTGSWYLLVVCVGVVLLVSTYFGGGLWCEYQDEQIWKEVRDASNDVLRKSNHYYTERDDRELLDAFPDYHPYWRPGREV